MLGFSLGLSGCFSQYKLSIYFFENNMKNKKNNCRDVSCYVLVRITILLMLLLSGCFVVKNPEVEDVSPTLALSPKPEIAMSEELVRSKNGDMIAFLPDGWFFYDLKAQESSEIFALAVNPDYTLCAVFSMFRKTDNLAQIVEKEGLLGLARLGFAKHERKTGGTVKLYGKYSPIEMGTNNFVKYEFTTIAMNIGGALSAKAVVFKSSIGQYYEFALIPMEIINKPLPNQDELDKIFRSIISTIKF